MEGEGQNLQNLAGHGYHSLRQDFWEGDQIRGDPESGLGQVSSEGLEGIWLHPPL